MRVAKLFLMLGLSCLLIFLTACGQEVKDDSAEIELGTSESGETITPEVDEGMEPEESTSKEEYKMLADMFVKYGKYNNGCYRFTKTDVQGDVIFVYGFTYFPSSKQFICDCGVYTYLSPYRMVDYGVYSFSPTEKTFIGNHRLESEYNQETVSSVTFNYSINDTAFTDYTYKIVENTYPNLDRNSKDEYSATCFECIKQGMMYANTIIKAYLE